MLLFFLLLLFFPSAAKADTLQQEMEKQLESLPLEEMESIWQETFPQEDFRTLLGRFARGEAVLNSEKLLQSLSQAFLETLTASLYRISHLLLPAILCGVMERLKSSFSSAALSDMLCAACFLLIAAVMARDLYSHMQLCRENVDRMAAVMQALFPLLLTLLAAVGSTAGAAFFQPATVAACGVMCTLVHRFTLPLTLGAAVTGMLDHLSPKVRLSRLSSLLKTLGNWTLGVGFTVFLSVTALQALGAAAADGVSLRTAKYMVDNFVPVVGGMFADTMDTLVGASLLIKNALGVTGLLLLLAAAARPMLQTLATVLVYRACAALLEPISEKRISANIHHFSQMLMLLFVIQLSVSAMFLLLVAQMLAVGQWTVMLR